MVHTNEKTKKADLSKVDVGEIDTRAPFQSVKDAVNLFGEVAFSPSGEKPNVKKAASPLSIEKALAEETRLLLVQKEMNKLNEQLRNAENTKAEALVELEKAKRTVKQLLLKLEAVTESKEDMIQAIEFAKNQVKLLVEPTITNGFRKEDSGSGNEKYTNVLSELNSAKQELAKIRQDYESSVEAKAVAVKQVEGAEMAASGNSERAYELSKETELAETMSGIEVARKELESAKASDVNSVRNVTSDLDCAKESLRKLLEEEISLQKLVNSLKEEFENLRKEHVEVKEKEAETESFAANLHVELQKYKSELEASLAEEADEANMSEIRALDLINALSESNAKITNSREELEKVAGARQEVEEMKRATEEALKKAEMAEKAKKAIEGELRRLREKEEKKAAEAATRILDVFSEKTNGHKVILPKISGIFHKKKIRGEIGSPSYLPGEK